MTSESLSALLQGFGTALQPEHLVWALVGTVLGTIVGILPGIGPALTVALLLPVTFHVEPVNAFIMFAGIYYGAMYGGSTTSILMNTPGESGSIITALDGYRMARAGRASAALATAAIGSFVAGTIGTMGLTVAAPVLVEFALSFGPAEYFALIVAGFTTISAVLGETPIRGLLSLFFGLALGLVGIDLQTGQARYTFGFPELLDGIDVVVVVVGLFAVGETLYAASRHYAEASVLSVKGWTWMSRDDWARSWKPWLRGAALGFPLGALPIGGAEIPTFFSYWLEKKLSRNPDEFGNGAIEGVAGPEAANNASTAGVLVPLLTLGLPTSATAAIMLAAFQQYNLQPGPLLFASNPDLVWGLIASLYVGNTMLLVLNLPLAPVWARLLEIPQPLLYAGILMFATLGTYSVSNSIFDVGVMYLIGLVGFAMRKFDFPIAPAIIGLILGPMAEQQFRRALAISAGDPSVFLTRPLSATLLGIAALVLLGPTAWERIRRRRQTHAVPTPRP
ncbi:MAG TPA: tripartite tricarboxylate transporter permease [Myxococcaceae bacterium]|nr:tripartite tricarboxylate transporter permease [Myxococcaceae bacterium]